MNHQFENDNLEKGETERNAKDVAPLRESEMKMFGSTNKKVNDEGSLGINGDY